MSNITLTNSRKNRKCDWGHQLIGGGKRGRIRIMFQNMSGIGNTSDKPRQKKLDTLEMIMINEGISIEGISEVNSNWSKNTIREKIYNEMD